MMTKMSDLIPITGILSINYNVEFSVVKANLLHILRERKNK